MITVVSRSEARIARPSTGAGVVGASERFGAILPGSVRPGFGRPRNLWL